MNVRSLALLLSGLALGCLLVACSANRVPGPSAQAQTSEASGQVPPGIKKDVLIAFDVVANYPGSNGLFFQEWPVVKEVKGNWVLVEFTPTEIAVKNGWKKMEYWINFHNVVHYRTK